MERGLTPLLYCDNSGTVLRLNKVWLIGFHRRLRPFGKRTKMFNNFHYFSQKGEISYYSVVLREQPILK